MLVPIGNVVHAGYENGERVRLFPEIALLVHGLPFSELADC